MKKRWSGDLVIAFSRLGSDAKGMRWLGDQCRSQAGSAQHVPHSFQVVDHRGQTDFGLQHACGQLLLTGRSTQNPCFGHW